MFTPQRLLLSLVAVSGVGAVGSSPRAPASPQAFKDARITIEFNATAQDVGLQVFADAESWQRLTIAAPNGVRLCDMRGTGNMDSLGMGELFCESDQASLSDLPLDQFRSLFPAGEYEFNGITNDGRWLTGSAFLTHDIPDGAVIVAPAPGSLQDPAHTVIDWDPVTSPPGIRITEYEVIVEQVSPHREMSIHVPAAITSLQIPPEFFEPAHDYRLEVLAIEVGGNQTISEGSFTTQ